jgi:superfamily II DNA or RNA helicase
VTRTARPYQSDSIRALQRDVDHGLNRLAIVLPTGSGKGFVIGMAVDEFHGKRTLIMANREELMDQIEDTVREMRPDLSIGIAKATRNEVDADVIIASIQSMSPARCLSITDVDLMIIDECHYGASASFMRVVDYFGGFDERETLLVGFTATMVRNDDLGLGDLFQKVSFQRDLAWAVRNKFVVPDRRVDVLLPALDLTGLPRTDDGEYDLGAVGALLLSSGVGPEIARQYRIRGGERRGVVFAPTKAVAHALSGHFDAEKITNAVITGDTKRDERKRIYAAARAGLIQVMINVGVLIAGFDDPGIGCVMVVTMTKAQSRLTQMVGRGMRLDPDDPGKRDCLALIMVGVEAEVATVVELKRVGTKPAPSRTTSPPKPITSKARAETARAAARYRARMDGVHLVVVRIVAGVETEIDRRPVAASKAQKMAEMIIKVDQLKRSIGA